MINLNARPELEETPLNIARNKFRERPFGAALFSTFHHLTRYKGEVVSGKGDPDTYLRGEVVGYPFTGRGYNITLVTAGDRSRLTITKPNFESEKEPKVVFAVEVNSLTTNRGLSAIDRSRILKGREFQVMIARTTNTPGSPEADLYYRMDILMKSYFKANFEAKTVAPQRQDEVSLAS